MLSTLPQRTDANTLIKSLHIAFLEIVCIGASCIFHYYNTFGNEFVERACRLVNVCVWVYFWYKNHSERLFSLSLFFSCSWMVSANNSHSKHKFLFSVSRLSFSSFWLGAFITIHTMVVSWKIICYCYCDFPLCFKYIFCWMSFIKGRKYRPTEECARRAEECECWMQNAKCVFVMMVSCRNIVIWQWS